MSFDHNKLVTHGIAITDESQGPISAVLFDMKAFKQANADAQLQGLSLFKLADLHPDAVNVVMASLHMYQMIVRNTIGLTHLQKEVKLAEANRAIGPIFARELTSMMQELIDLNRVTRELVLNGYVAADKQLSEMNGKDKPI